MLQLSSTWTSCIFSSWMECLPKIQSNPPYMKSHSHLNKKKKNRATHLILVDCKYLSGLKGRRCHGIDKSKVIKEYKEKIGKQSSIYYYLQWSFFSPSAHGKQSRADSPYKRQYRQYQSGSYETQLWSALQSLSISTLVIDSHIVQYNLIVCVSGTIDIADETSFEQCSIGVCGNWVVFRKCTFVA